MSVTIKSIDIRYPKLNGNRDIDARKNMVFLQFHVPPLLSVIRYPYIAQCPGYLTLPTSNFSRAELRYSISDIYIITTNKMYFFLLLIYFNNHPQHVSNRLTLHHPDAVYCTCSLWYLSFIYVD